MGWRRSLKYSFHQSTTSFIERHTIPTVHSVEYALLPRPQTPDDGPEPFQRRLEVILHGLTKLLSKIFASATPTTAHCLACGYLFAASGVPQAKKNYFFFFTLTACLTADVHLRVRHHRHRTFCVHSTSRHRTWPTLTQ